MSTFGLPTGEGVGRFEDTDQAALDDEPDELSAPPLVGVVVPDDESDDDVEGVVDVEFDVDDDDDDEPPRLSVL